MQKSPRLPPKPANLFLHTLTHACNFALIGEVAVLLGMEISGKNQPHKINDPTAEAEIDKMSFCQL